jgi:hypothetical protein
MESVDLLQCSQHPPLFPILSQLHPIHTFRPYFCKIYSNIIFPSTPRSSQLSPLFRFSTKTFVLIFHISFACYMSHPCLPPWFDYPNNVWYACRKRRLKWVSGAWGYNWATLPLGDINTEVWSSRVGVGRGTKNPTLYKENCWEASKKFSRITEEVCGGGQGLSWAVEPRR